MQKLFWAHLEFNFLLNFVWDQLNFIVDFFLPLDWTMLGNGVG